MRENQAESTATRLTATFVKNVKDAGSYGDARGGFGLRLLVRESASGRLSKGFVQRVRINGRATNVGLGSYPLTTLDDAREAAYQNARAVRQGVNVLAARRALAIVPTFREAADATIALNAASWKAGSRNADGWRQRLADYAMPRLGRMPVDAITSGDVLACVTPIWSSKPAASRKVLHYIAAVMAWAVAHGHRADNPAKGDAIKAALPRRRTEVKHHRAMHYSDLRDALAKVDAADAFPAKKLAIRFLALTATRSGEVRGMTWAEVDGATWTIPAERTKMGREHRVPLSHAALAVFEAARQYADGSTLIFPSTTGKRLADSVFSATLRSLGVESTPHGFRSTFRTWASEVGADRELAEHALGHVEGSAAERAYQRGDLFERRAELMEQWANQLGQAAS